MGPVPPLEVMLDRHSDLSEARQAEFDAFARDVRERMFDEVEAMLLEVGEDGLAQRVYDVAFAESEVLPQRSRRPDLHTALLAAASAEAYELGDSDSEALLGFTVAIQEYYDVLDDLIDGDVADGHETEVQLVVQVLLPLALGRLGRLGSGAVSYWTERALELVAAPYAEHGATPSASAYRDLVDRQSVLFAFVPGLAAVAAGCDEAGVERAEAVGRAIYRHQQFARDYEQHAAGDDDPWNAAALLGRATTIEELEHCRTTVEELTEPYPEPARERLRGLVALDVDPWRDEVADG